MPRVVLTVSEDERRALVDLARSELRDPRAQAALLLRQSLIEIGLLPATKTGQPARPSEVTQ